MYRFLIALSCACLYGGMACANLITNGNFEAGNSGFTSAYMFSPGNLVPAKRYDVVFGNASDLGADNANFILFGDHTTGTGKFFAANGAADQSTVWSQNVTLQPNTLYGLAAWVSTLFPLSPAVLRFAINGVQVGADYTAPAAAGVWAQFTGTFFRARAAPFL